MSIKSSNLIKIATEHLSRILDAESTILLFRVNNFFCCVNNNDHDGCRMKNVVGISFVGGKTQRL